MDAVFNGLVKKHGDVLVLPSAEATGDVLDPADDGWVKRLEPDELAA